MRIKSASVAGPGISYGDSRTLDLPFNAAVAHVIETLGAEGFGVLCRIDIREKLKERLGVDFRNYVILGACNPPLAYRSLQEEISLGLLLPCNVIVYEEEGRSVVSAIDAAKMLSVAGNPRLEAVAVQVAHKLALVFVFRMLMILNPRAVTIQPFRPAVSAQPLRRRHCQRIERGAQCFADTLQSGNAANGSQHMRRICALASPCFEPAFVTTGASAVFQRSDSRPDRQ